MNTRAALLLFSLLAAAALPSSAQELESLAGARIDLVRPGARALGMGATGIALRGADAAMANPAAIAGAQRSFTIEGGRRTIEGRYVGDDRLGTVSTASATRGISSAAMTLSFAGLTWSFTYDDPLDVDHSTTAAFGDRVTTPFFICDGHISAAACDAAPVEFHLPATLPIDARVRMQRYGATAAWSAGPIALGASLRRETLRERTSVITAAGLPSSGVAETVDDRDLTWSAGALWNASPRTTVGATYASGGSFAGARTFFEFPASAIEFRTPSSYGVGVALDVLPNLTVAADARRVRYSEMMHDRRSAFPQQSELGYPDVTEVHAGGEYRIGRVALRAGWWREPAHALSILNGIEPPSPMQYTAAIVDGDQDHVTAGIGYGAKTRLEASVDRASRSTRIVFGVSSAF